MKRSLGLGILLSTLCLLAGGVPISGQQGPYDPEARLAELKAMLGDRSRVVRVVKVLGMVKSATDFVDQPAVINGFSDLIVEVFGERGRHARAAVGMAALPRGQAVEIELVVEVEPGMGPQTAQGDEPLELTP